MPDCVWVVGVAQMGRQRCAAECAVRFEPAYTKPQRVVPIRVSRRPTKRQTNQQASDNESLARHLKGVLSAMASATM